MKSFFARPIVMKIADVLFVLLIIAGGVYGRKQYLALKFQLARTQALLATTTTQLQEGRILSQAEKEQLALALESTQANIANLEESKKVLNDEVSTYQKLNSLDPELLQKYSKVYFLNEHYTPSGLATISKEYTANKNREEQIHAQVWPRLEQMFTDSTDEGLSLLAASSYRSFTKQSTLKAAYRVTYGTTAANRFSADQGYSEHQLGTTLDFTTAKSLSLSSSFDKTPEFKWLTEHAHEYGFVLSYPKNNKYYIYEPWHWRYVGIALATKLHDDGKYLYDIDQREIDTYLLNIFD